MVDTWIPDGVGRTVSVLVVDVLDEPSLSKQNGDDNGNGYGVGDGSPGSSVTGWTG